MSLKSTKKNKKKINTKEQKKKKKIQGNNLREKINMEGCDTNNSTSSATLSHQSPSPTSSSSPPPRPPAPQVVMSPCAACKILRRRCAEKCVLAPYFPPTEPTKFTIAHRVFGASNIIKLLQVVYRTRDIAINYEPFGFS